MRYNYYWVCQYHDGEQFPATIEEAKEELKPYREIDQDRLECFDIYNRDTDELILRVHFDDPDKRLIHVRRKDKLSTGELKVYWLVGWQKKVNGKNVQSIQLIFPDGHIESIGEWKEPPFNKPKQAN